VEKATVSGRVPVLGFVVRFAAAGAFVEGSAFIGVATCFEASGLDDGSGCGRGGSNPTAVVVSGALGGAATATLGASAGSFAGSFARVFASVRLAGSACSDSISGLDCSAALLVAAVETAGVDNVGTAAVGSNTTGTRRSGGGGSAFVSANGCRFSTGVTRRPVHIVQPSHTEPTTAS
jgi:hypothetical protein